MVWTKKFLSLFVKIVHFLFEARYILFVVLSDKIGETIKQTQQILKQFYHKWIGLKNR